MFCVKIYFCTPPEQLIFSHWPDDKKWQLLENPLCLREFQPLQDLIPCSFNLGVSKIMDVMTTEQKFVFELGVLRSKFKELLKIDSNANEPVVISFFR